MSYLISQYGSEPKLATSSTSAANYLCSLFGLPFSRVEGLVTQIEKIEPNKSLVHPDLSLRIYRY